MEDPCVYKCIFSGFGLIDDEGGIHVEKFIEVLDDTKPEEVEEYNKCDDGSDPCIVAKCLADVNDKYNDWKK